MINQQRDLEIKATAKAQGASHEINKINQRYGQQLTDLEKLPDSRLMLPEKMQRLLKRAAAAQEQYRQELLRISAFTNELVKAEEALKRNQQALDNLSSFLDGGAMDFSRQAPAGLDDLSQVGDRGDFESRTRNIGASLEEGKRLAEKVISTSQAIDLAKVVNLRMFSWGT